MQMTSQLVNRQGQLLNHVEVVYRPGERELTGKIFEVLGCGVLDRPGKAHLVVHVNKGNADIGKNVIFASEATPEQLKLEEILKRHLTDDQEFSEAYQAYQNLLKRKPQHAGHFGIRFPSVKALEDTLERVREVSQFYLAGRLEVSSVIRPGDPAAIIDTLIQAYVKTDVFAFDLFCLGQHIELQAVTESS